MNEERRPPTGRPISGTINKTDHRHEVKANFTSAGSRMSTTRMIELAASVSDLRARARSLERVLASGVPVDGTLRSALIRLADRNAFEAAAVERDLTMESTA